MALLQCSDWLITNAIELLMAWSHVLVTNCLSHLSAPAGSPGIAAYDEKNIRRRVYDALNVLMAMDIIIKDKKDISWKGLPSAPHAQLEKLKEERAALRQKILNQQVYLQVCLCISNS